MAGKRTTIVTFPNDRITLKKVRKAMEAEHGPVSISYIFRMALAAFARGMGL